VSRAAALGWTARTSLRDGIQRAYDSAPFRRDTAPDASSSADRLSA
jgi:GDP-L-fucose synthase